MYKSLKEIQKIFTKGEENEVTAMKILPQENQVHRVQIQP